MSNSIRFAFVAAVFGALISCKNQPIATVRDDASVATKTPTIAEAVDGGVVAIDSSADKPNGLTVELANRGNREVNCRVDFAIDGKPHVTAQSVPLPQLSKRRVELRFIGEAASFKFDKVANETFRLLLYDCLPTAAAGSTSTENVQTSARVLAEGKLSELVAAIRKQ